LKSVLFFKTTGLTSSTFPIQPDVSQNQPAAITLNTGSPRTLIPTSFGFPSLIKGIFSRFLQPDRQSSHKVLNFNRFFCRFLPSSLTGEPLDFSRSSREIDSGYNLRAMHGNLKLAPR
jgi:hypothetical protein